MGEANRADLQVAFDRRIRVQFQGAKVTSDAGLLAIRELDEGPGLIEPEVYQYLEEEGIRYAIRVPANEVLTRYIDHLLTGPVGPTTPATDRLVS